MDALPTISAGFELLEQISNSFWYWKALVNWSSSSTKILSEVEEKILSFLTTPYSTFYVEIGAIVGAKDQIWTISLNTNSQEVPLVLLHGLGSGIGLWILNLDDLSAERPVYAMDILGFGRSSRPLFSSDPAESENQFVRSIEAWRAQMNFNEMILLGHSMGGFLASSYALCYPEHVKHLILADPWGFPEMSEKDNMSKRFPRWVRTLAHITTPFNLLCPIRAAGPFGKWLIRTVRRDIVKKFEVISENKSDHDLFPLYIHQCNAQYPSGETAFHSMLEFLGCAKNPMFNRIINAKEDLPITFIFGKSSWIDPNLGERIKSQRSNSFVEIKEIKEAGHHVYADKSKEFNAIVNEACSMHKSRK